MYLYRKYLRDVDRIQLSQLAFVYCLDALEENSQLQQPQQSEAAGADDDDKLHKMLLTYQVRQYAAKMQTALSQRADKLLMSAYNTYIDVEVSCLLCVSVGRACVVTQLACSVYLLVL